MRAEGLDRSCEPLSPCWLEHHLLVIFEFPFSDVECGHVAVGQSQHQWYHFGVGAPPILEPILVGIGMFNGG